MSTREKLIKGHSCPKSILQRINLDSIWKQFEAPATVGYREKPFQDAFVTLKHRN